MAWLAAWLLTIGLIAATGYTTGDPDSRLYAGISAHLVSEPVSHWIAPEWWGLWGFTGPYTEHPVGMFVVPAVFGRLGYPAAQSAFAINALYQVLSFVLAASIAATIIAPRDARALAWLLQLLPIAFVFRVRANQEYAVLAALFFALYATERSRTDARWTAGMIAGFCAVLVVKGVFAFIVPVTCAMWLLARGTAPASSRGAWPAWAAIGVMPIVGVAVVWAYELAYVRVTGRSFLAAYRARQVPEGALTTGSPIARTTYNLVWYLGRVVWFAFPWSLAAGALVVRGLRGGGWRAWPVRAGVTGSLVGSRATGAGDVDPAPDHRLDDAAARAPASEVSERQGAWFGVLASAALVACFSLAHRKADRYIFPVYFILGATGAICAIRRVPRLERLVERLDRPWVPAVAYVLLFLLRLVTRGKLPEFTFWRT